MDAVICDRCGIAIEEGADAIATTTGRIDALVEGFYMSDTEPWLAVYHADCWTNPADLRALLADLARAAQPIASKYSEINRLHEHVEKVREELRRPDGWIRHR